MCKYAMSLPSRQIPTDNQAGKHTDRRTDVTMERFVAETDEYRSRSVHDLISLKGKTAVVTGMFMRPPTVISRNES